VQDYDVELILSVINIQHKELIGLLVIIGPAILVENVLLLVVFESELLEVDVLHDLPGLVQLDACVDLFSKDVHLVCAGFLFAGVALYLIEEERLVVVRYVVIPKLKVRDLELTVLEFLYLHQFYQQLLQILVANVVVECHCHRDRLYLLLIFCMRLF
jgi:hypothetical protein